LEILASGITDVGLKREGNEDSFSTDESLGLYVVADGMGGHLAGEVASRIAVDLINKSFRIWGDSDCSEDDIYGLPDYSLSRKGNYILGGIRLANRVIHELASSNEKYHGMGTTVASIVTVSDMVIAANVGDSRIYMIRNGEIERLSKDHTIVSEQVEMGIMSEEEAENSPMKHILTRNLGSAEKVDPEVFEIQPANDDRFVICSDGITDLITDDEILTMVEENDDPESLCRTFVNTALKRGGHDNITIITLSLSGIAEPKSGPLRQIGSIFVDFFINIQKIIKKLKP
jgi:protein phosphatase